MSKTKEMVAEPKTEETFDVCYKSKLLNKYFDSKEELVEAEKKYHEENDAKLKEIEEKKSRAKEVEDAYLEYTKVKEEAYKQIADAEKKWIELRDKFSEDYHGYHMTYTNNNGKKTITFSDLVDSLFNW